MVCLSQCGSTANKLKTLIIKNTHVELTISGIEPHKIPELEWFEFWFNDINHRELLPVVRAIGIILSETSVPNLTYLSFCGCRGADRLIKALMKISFVKQLSILNVSMGGMSDLGVKHILNCPNLENLTFLDVSDNFISESGIEELRQLPFQIKDDNQHSYVEERDERDERYAIFTRYERSCE